MNVEDPVDLLLTLHARLSAKGLRPLTYGALALAAYGRSRFTEDVDFAVVEKTIGEIAYALRQIFPRIMRPFTARPFGGLNVSRMTVFGEMGGMNTVDLVSPNDAGYGERMMARGLSGQLGETAIPIVAPEDYLILKVLSTRERDLADAASVVSKLGGDLDMALVREEIEALAKVIPGHPVAERFQRVLDWPKEGSSGF
jgi:hypothetical protein